MKKLLVTLIGSFLISSAAYAGGFGFGVTGSFVQINGQGTETTTAGTIAGGAANVNSRAVDNQTGLASGYIEYSMDDVSWANNGFTLGASMTPGSANVSDATLTRVETAQGASSGTVTRKAQAEVDNLNNIYLEIPIWSSVYVKVGQSSIDVTTTEAAVTGSGTYGNASIDGQNYGIGVRGMSGNIVWKFAYEETDFDTLKLTSSTSNTVQADLDTEELNFSVGYRF